MTDEGALPDILYIMGTGRSGTTILEILLANNPGFLGVGEVKHIFRDGFVRDLPCGCGKPGRECELWSAVLKTTEWKPDEWAGHAREIERVESHQRFPAAWAGLPQERTAAYARVNESLFTAVAAAKQCRVVVDSSKFAGRALLLSRCFAGKVKVLCITRSADGIIKAFKKKNDVEQRPKGALAVTAYYLYVLLCMGLVKWRLKERCYAIRFEELQRDPAGVLRRIEAWSGYSLGSARQRLETGDWFDVGHIVTGNRLRKAGRVKFEPGSAGKVAARRGIVERALVPVLESYRSLMGF